MEFAFELARLNQAEISVVHIYPNRLSPELEKELAQELDDFSKEINNSGNVSVSSRVLQGDTINRICEPDVMSAIDLVLMGTQGASDSKSELVGSNTINVLNKCNKPVLVVPAKANYTSIRSTMFCSDYEQLEINHSLSTLKELVMAFNSTLRIVHIKTSNSSPNPNRIEESRREGKFFEPEVTPQFKLVHSRNVFEGINYYMDLKGDVDLVAMVNRKHNFFDRLFRTNNTHKMAYHAEVPLLVLPE